MTTSVLGWHPNPRHPTHTAQVPSNEYEFENQKDKFKNQKYDFGNREYIEARASMPPRTERVFLRFSLLL